MTMTLRNKKAMTLRNKKANQNDRISDLPSNVIDEILGNLRILDQLRTSIFSKKWRYMWTSATQIYFDEDFFEWFGHLEDLNPVIPKIITDVLMLHNGPIHKFTLFTPHTYGFNITVEYLNMWIPILSRKDIKYLDLVNYETVPDEMPYIVLSCKELTYFRFGGFNLSIPPNFCGFKKLLELHLDLIKFEYGALESLMSGCPILEQLTIEHCDDCDYLVISSPSLKVLVLGLSDDMKSISLKRAKDLIDFKLDAKQIRVSGLKSLPKIKRFYVRRSFINTNEKKPYADIIPPTLLTSSFLSLEYLKLSDVNLNERGELLYIVRVLKSAPRLIELVIKSYNNVDTSQVSNHSEELECSSCCPKLQTVEIYVGASSEHAMSLIKFILANSPSLKILTFYFNFKKLHTGMLFNISQNLLWMERASPRAHVKFLHSTQPLAVLTYKRNK